MNKFLLPDTIDILGVTFLINWVTLSIAAIPVLWLVFLWMYIYKMRKQDSLPKKRPAPLQLSEFSSTYYQYDSSFAPGVNLTHENMPRTHARSHAESANNYPDFFNDSSPSPASSPASGHFYTSPSVTSRSETNSAIDLEIEDIELIPIAGSDGYYADDLTRAVEIPAFILQPIAHLELVEGDEHLPRTFAIGGDAPVRFGRRKSLCDYVIEDMRISRLHATMVPREDSISIRDEGSSGGTFVNQQRLGLTDEVALKDQDVISFNDISYRIVLVD